MNLLNVYLNPSQSELYLMHQGMQHYLIKISFIQLYFTENITEILQFQIGLLHLENCLL